MLAALLRQPATTESARAALDATFRQRAYDRTLRETVWRRIVDWVGDRLSDIFRAAARSPNATRAIIVGIAILAALFVARAFYTRWQRRDIVPSRRGGTLREGDDPWKEAATLAARGDYTAAAHALYAALLTRLARRERLRRHPSKTAGDYVRELRTLASPAHAPFREFARDYDVVVYGIGTCDATRYARLLGLADVVLRGERVAEASRG